jgi:hypothetical protein
MEPPPKKGDTISVIPSGKYGRMIGNANDLPPG